MDFSFARPTADFELRVAHRLVAAAELAYRRREEVEEVTIRQFHLPRFVFFSDKGTQGYIASDRDHVLVCFRGTESTDIRDWVTDANCELVPGPLSGKVHAGFYDALACIWCSLDREIGRMDPDGKKTLYVTGHSLGAALATLEVARWLDQGRPVKALYTFGQPRTGDNTFARHFNLAFKPFAFRFVNNNDLVTRIAPRSFGYSHLGTFKYFTEKGDFKEEISWWDRFLDSWQGRMDDIFDGGSDAIKDHRIAIYRARIEALLPPILSISEYRHQVRHRRLARRRAA